MNKIQPYSLSNVLQARARLGEGPIWDTNEELLYWVDIYNHRVHKFNPSTGQDSFFEVSDVVGTVAKAGANRLIMAQRHCLTFLNTQTGQVTPIVEVETNLPNNRFNDGKCDPQGRFWFGSMSQEINQASLYRYDPDGSLHTMQTGLTTSNGLGWSPDQKTFYLTDSPEKKIYAYDFEPITGNISNRRVFVDLTHEQFYPDGLTIDSEGHIWSAMWAGSCVIRFQPNGEEIARINLPVNQITSCTFGGKNLQTLYITTAAIGLKENEIENYFYAGDLFALETDITGLAANEFQG